MSKWVTCCPRVDHQGITEQSRMFATYSPIRRDKSKTKRRKSNTMLTASTHMYGATFKGHKRRRNTGSTLGHCVGHGLPDF